MHVSTLIKDIRHASKTLRTEPDQAIPTSNEDNVDDLKKLVAAARDLIAAVEPNEDAIWNIILGVSLRNDVQVGT